MEITSLNNEVVKETVKLQQKKYRQESGKFLLEGYKSVYEAVKSGVLFDKVFVESTKLEKYGFIKGEIISTNSAVLKKISTTDTPPEVVGVAFQPKNDMEKLKTSNKVVLLENISDAGNLGTIIRTASAFNIESIILYGKTVDLYNPKCVRSAVGNLWKTNIVNIDKVEVLDKYFKDYERVATLPKSDNTVWFREWKPQEKTLLMFGSEADGLSEELIQYSNKRVTIEMTQSVESLNLSVSAGVFMYALNSKA